MARYKTFNSTGIAPDGRLYAGDLNAIQDFLAKQADFTQTVDLGTLRIGETGLQLTRYGAGEARISGVLRTDGLVNAGGGLLAGTFTTTQRNAIPAGQRPPGLTIYNSTINRYETNFGTDAAPVWGVAGEPIAGVMWPWPYAEAGVPAGWALCYGQSVTKVANPQLWALANAAGFPHGGDASNVTLPDMRGRHPVGKDNMGGVAAGRVGTGNQGQTLGGSHGSENNTLLDTQMPYHNHTVNSHAHGGGNHGHGITDSGHYHSVIYSYDYVINSGATSSGQRVTGISADWARTVQLPENTSSVGTGISVNNSGNTIGAEAPATDYRGGSATVTQPHNNLQPGLISNWIIKLG